MDSVRGAPNLGSESRATTEPRLGEPGHQKTRQGLAEQVEGGAAAGEDWDLVCDDRSLLDGGLGADQGEVTDAGQGRGRVHGGHCRNAYGILAD